MSDYEDDKLGRIFPTREGAPQGSRTERVMLDKAGGASGFRTVIENNPDGSTTMLRTRGGMPHFSTTPVEVESREEVKRTFVFNKLESPIAKKAKVANRGNSAGEMKVSAKKIDVGAPCYFIAQIKTRPKSGKSVKWNDVVRLDYDPTYDPKRRTIRINGGDVTDVFPDNDVTMFPEVGAETKYFLPYLHTVKIDDKYHYIPSLPDSSPRRSPLFLGISTAQNRRLYSLGVNGDEADHFDPTGKSLLHQIASAGLRLDDHKGEYGFYGGSCINNHPEPSVGSSYKSLSSVKCVFSECRSNQSAPYIEELRYGNKDVLVFNQVVVNFNLVSAQSEIRGYQLDHIQPIFYCVRSPSGVSNEGNRLYITWPATNANTPLEHYPELGVGSDGVFSEISVAGTCDSSIPDYAFGGSKIAMSLDVTFLIDYSSSGDGPKYEYVGDGLVVAGAGVPSAWPSPPGPTGGGETGGQWERYNAYGSYGYLVIRSRSMHNHNSTLVTSVKLNIDDIPSPSDVVVTVSNTAHHHYEFRFDDVDYIVPEYVEERVFPSEADAIAAMSGVMGETLKSDAGFHGNATILANVAYRTTVANCIATTRDFVFADIEEQVFLYLEGKFNITRRSVLDTAHVDWMWKDPIEDSGEDGSRLEVNWVLDVRGKKHEFSVREDLLLPEKTWFELVKFYPSPADHTSPHYGVEESAIGGAFCHKGYRPPPIWNPRFMHQGNCPFIAYTTKDEEKNGATPEVYLDMKVRIMRYEDLESGTIYDSTEFDDGLDEGIVKFTPHQFIHAHNKFVCGETVEGGVLVTNKSIWDEMFPPGKDKRLQLYNGTKGAVANKLGSGFGGNPIIEISRI